ncbi:YlzJ-like family protein [Paenibacillus luteus]|uniref:YlzJ-like family protein n=1 Tax=Paenibacillus luteus TaxID=2545753 RepID=UPI001141727E|nr:YlzJ-like family protein [Paenibacillus luteus]
MTIYTNMPLELVFEGLNDESVQIQEVWSSGVRMQVTPLAPGMGKIVRLIDCSLNDYLNPNLMPGMIVHYK